MNPIIRGVVWKCGDDVTAYQIIAQRRWTLQSVDPEELGKWAFEDLWDEVNDVPYGFRDSGYDIVVAGHDFGGGGKSIEHPVVSMQGAGVKLTIAESFSRYNFRNSINRGLPAMTCKGATDLFDTGDALEADLLSGEIKNLTTGKSAQTVPFPKFMLDILEAGGVLNYYHEKN
jgi:3-isopropylmalate/(R)-2-methylmalate dehydratase small subunit